MPSDVCLGVRAQRCAFRRACPAMCVYACVPSDVRLGVRVQRCACPAMCVSSDVRLGVRV